MIDITRLDGTQPYHRHGDRIHPGSGTDCYTDPAPGGRILVFDADALSAHDEAVRREAEAGAPDAPTITLTPENLTDEGWEWVMVEPTDLGDTTARILAGWTTDGEFRRYCTPERLARAFREALEAPHA